MKPYKIKKPTHRLRYTNGRLIATVQYKSDLACVNLTDGRKEMAVGSCAHDLVLYGGKRAHFALRFLFEGVFPDNLVTEAV